MRDKYIYAILLTHGTQSYLCQLKGNDLYEVWRDAQELAGQNGFKNPTNPEEWAIVRVNRVDL